MTDFHDLLQRAAPEPRTDVNVEDLSRRADRQRTRSRVVGGLVAVLAAATLFTVGLTVRGDERSGRVDTAGIGDPSQPEVRADQGPDGAIPSDTTLPIASPKAPSSEAELKAKASPAAPGASGVDSSGHLEERRSPSQGSLQEEDAITLADAEGDTEASPFAAPLVSRNPEPYVDILAAELRPDPTSGMLTTQMSLADLSDAAPPGSDGARYEWRTTLTSSAQSIDLLIEVQRYNDDQFVRFITYSGPDLSEILPCEPGCDIEFDMVHATVSVNIPAQAVERLLDALSFEEGQAVNSVGLSAQTVWVHTTRDATSCDRKATRTECSGPYANAPADTAEGASNSTVTIR